MNDNSAVHELDRFCQRLASRMLTQVCRDPTSPAYGSFDRNWWHYKIRDFSSIILQQGGYALYCASELPAFHGRRAALRALAAASCRFWNRRAGRFRAFEEYYPWEEGYPPVAFSSLSVAKLVSSGVIGADEVMTGLRNAAKQLQDRFEPRATNQQMAGTAALCWIAKIAPDLIDERKFRGICDRTLECQHAEGWYMEYGGPDLGYLSVTMDCLWDAYDATGDERFKASAARALAFMTPYLSLPMGGAGMHNARNTDYILPYGIVRFLNDADVGDAARLILGRTLGGIADPGHFLHAIDDRYYCHYIGHSLFRALPLLRDGDIDARRRTDAVDCYVEGTGHWLRSETPSGCAAMISAKKGGVFTLQFGRGVISDFGWTVDFERRQWVSHWWSDFWEITQSPRKVRIRGFMTPHKENESTPVKHLALRALSLVFGRRIIAYLKDKMIFKSGRTSPFAFTRDIEFRTAEFVVRDEIQVPETARIRRSPRSSKRHVASADSFHRDDLDLGVDVVLREETLQRKGQSVMIQTIYKERTI